MDERISFNDKHVGEGWRKIKFFNDILFYLKYIVKWMQKRNITTFLFFSIESETRIRCTYKIRLIITRIFSMSR